MESIIASEVDHARHVASLIERGIADGSIRSCDVLLTSTMLLAALRSIPGHYLIVDRDEWPDLDREVLIAIRQFLAPQGG